MASNVNKTIICYDVPLALLHKTEAKRYFKTFGSIVKIIVKQKSRKCIVEYENSESAQEALSLGGEYEGVEFPIEFQLKPTTTKAKTKPKKDVDPDWNMDDDVKAELEAMGMSAGGNYNMPGNKKQYNLRPEKMAIDVELNSLVKKATRTERSKKSSTTTSTTASSTKFAERDLLNILRQRAENTEDKYRMLDARDKLIRLRRYKNVDVHMLGVTVGTCPDMCPEKERLMREVQHQVALYEQTSQAGDRSMNHSIAVKQYSRSSADQEAPLPHELRGVEVLQMTMGYLMHRIMRLADSPDCNLGEWYHFLWDRMRGIRKDITQQELCCEGSVRLVEQCARFHVHCSARLVAEDAAVFDQKINTENLTKCLQTLKYMYNDLAIQGVRCPDEAEFRAYVILLNLNDGNFMWEVQQLRADIQKSPEIKFALEVYSSLDKNNFVKFFKLVRATTYLNACILLRYFIQVRTKAMRLIARCYTPRLPHAQFPIAQLIEMLAFEGVSSCVDFVEHCGLTVSSDRSTVLLNKRDFQDPDVPYVLDRAVRVIESKQRQSLGEVVCGQELPPPLYETHVPHDSFDQDGYLQNLDDFDLEQVTQDEPDRAMFKINERSSSPFGGKDSREAPPPKVVPKVGGFAFDLPQQHDLAREKAEYEARLREQHEAEKEAELKRYQEQMRIEKQKLHEQQQLIEASLERERLEYEHRMQLQREEQRRQMEEARIKEEERQLEEERIRQQKLKDFQRMEEEELKRKQLQQRQRAEEARRRQIALQEAKAAEIAETHRLQEIRSAVFTVVSKLVTDVEKNYRKNRLKELRTNVLARFALQKWRVKVSSNKRKRKAIDLGPLWMNKLTSQEIAKELSIPQQSLTLNLMKRYKRGVANNSPEGRVLPLVEKLDARTLMQLTANHLLRNAMQAKRLQNDIFWKVGVYFEERADDGDLVRKTMDEAMGWDQVKVLLKRVKVNQNNLTYCLQKTAMDVSEQMNALLIVTRKLTEELVDKLLVYLNSLGDLECMPVYFVLEEEDDQLKNEVEVLLKNKLISEKDCLVCAFLPDNLSVALGRGLEFLSQQYRPPPPLLLNTLRAFLGENLGGEFFQKVRAFSKWNLPYKHCVAKPQVAIALFNQGLQKLEDIILDEQRCDYASFPEIFKEHLANEIPDFLPCDFKYFPKFWKTDEYNSALKRALKQFQLPQYNGEWPLEAGPNFERDIFDYCELVCAARPEAEKLFYKVVAKLLRTAETGNQSWMDVAEVILEHNLKCINLEFSKVFISQTIFNQLIVIFQSDHLHGYTNDPWYYLKNPMVQREIETSKDGEQDGEVDARSISPRIYEAVPDEIVLDLDLHLKRAFEPDLLDDERQANAKKCRAAMDDFRFLMDDLEESMKIQRKVSQKFQANLKNYLDNT